METTYHKDVYLPESFCDLIPKKLSLKWGFHAIQQASEDKRGKIPVVNQLDFKPEYLVEYTPLLSSCKVLLRLPYNECDICMVVLVEEDRHFVKTVWLNDKRDVHSTLDVERYMVKNG